MHLNYHGRLEVLGILSIAGAGGMGEAVLLQM